MRRTIDQPQSLLDALAALFPDSSRTTLRKMLQVGRVRVNGEAEVDAKRALAKGDFIDVAQKNVATLPPELTLLHEDDDLLVVLKQNGLLTVATEREKETTAQAYLDEYLKAKKGGRVHVVHRLDRETSGVLVFAKNFKARERLKELFAEHDVERVYVAVIEGMMSPPSGTIRTHLLERPDLRMVSVRPRPEAKLAITHYKTVRTRGQWSMLEVTLETGRKNQIRAHLSEAGHPIVGDNFYGSTVNPLNRLGLHAQLLGFVHPATGEEMRFEAPLPRSFRDLFGEEIASGS